MAAITTTAQLSPACNASLLIKTMCEVCPENSKTIVCVCAVAPTFDMMMFMQFVVAPCGFRPDAALAIRRSASLVTGSEQGLAEPGAEANSRCLP